MKKSVFTLLCSIILVHLHAQERYADVSSRVHYPDSGHMYVSPSMDSLTCWLFNHGPDTIYAVDRIYFSVKLSEIILGPATRDVGKDLAPGDSVYLKRFFQMKYSKAQPSIPVCSEVDVYSNFRARIPLQKENDSTHDNNRYCIDAVHALNYPTSVSDVSQEGEVTIFPNPSRGTFRLKTDIQIESIEVYNTMGKQLMRIADSKQVDLNGQVSGVYLLNIQTNLGTMIKKVVKI